MVQTDKAPWLCSLSCPLTDREASVVHQCLQHMFKHGSNTTTLSDHVMETPNAVQTYSAMVSK